MLDFYFDVENGLMLNGEKISSFEPRVTHVTRKIDINGNESFEYTVEVSSQTGESHGKKVFTRLEKIKWVQEFGIYDPKLKSEKILENKMILESRNCCDVCTKYVLPPGIHLVEGFHIMIIADCVILPKNFPSHISIESASKDKLRVGADKDSLKEKVRKYIMFEPKISVLLFFCSIYGMIKPILMSMEVNCDMLIALVAPSGHLKTTLVRLFALILKRNQDQEISFMDTMRNDILTNMIRSRAGLNFLIDDYHENSTPYTRRKYDERLNVATRVVSSAVSSAGVIITAEALKDSRNILFSSHDRIFKIQMPLQNAEKISQMKRKINELPDNDFLGDVVLSFSQALIDNYDEVKKKVGEHMKEDLPSGFVQSTRTGNQYRVLSLVEKLFMQFFYGEDEEIDKIFNSYLENACKNQMEELCRRRNIENEPNAIELIHTIIQEGTNCKELSIKCVESLYDASRDDTALISEGKLRITGVAFQNYMVRKLNHPVSLKRIVDQLEDVGALERDIDKRTKKYMNRRHYCINISVIESIFMSGMESI